MTAEERVEIQQRDGCEEWRPVRTFEGRYSVSNWGRVRLEHKTRLHEAGFILKQRIDSTGYPSADLDSARIRIHSLVALAFLGLKPASSYEINHRDGDKTNNHVMNLEWVTGARNRQHAFEIGLNHVGEQHGQAKLTAEQVRYIRSSRATSRELGKEIGVGGATIRDARRGTTWRHLS